MSHVLTANAKKNFCAQFTWACDLKNTRVYAVFYAESENQIHFPRSREKKTRKKFRDVLFSTLERHVH